jgi:hypothetical protein
MSKQVVELTDDELIRIYESYNTIAVVGASADESKPSHSIPLYMQTQGYKLLPINPKGGEIFGEKVHTSLEEVTEAVDIVDVFRPSEETPQIAKEAVAIGAKVLWLQVGISSDEAASIAAKGGLLVVMNRCIGVTHGHLGLGPGP